MNEFADDHGGGPPVPPVNPPPAGPQSAPLSAIETTAKAALEANPRAYAVAVPFIQDDTSVEILFRRKDLR